MCTYQLTNCYRSGKKFLTRNSSNITTGVYAVSVLDYVLENPNPVHTSPQNPPTTPITSIRYPLYNTAKGDYILHMSNSGGRTSLLQTLSDQKAQNEELRNENRTLQQRIDRKLETALSTFRDELRGEVEELREELKKNLEVTQDFLTNTYWRTKDKTKRRSDLVKARDEVSHGGQVIADLLTIEQVMSRTNSNTSLYSECFREAYGMSLAQAILRLEGGPCQMRKIVNVLCSIRKLDSWKLPARQTDRQKIESIAVDLIARFLQIDVATEKKLFVVGSGCRELYTKMISLYDNWKLKVTID
ncbi:hypothetical protein V8E54_010062 [Elaphomyces granulatus]